MPLVTLAREEQAVQAAAQSAETARSGRYNEDQPRSGAPGAWGGEAAPAPIQPQTVAPPTTSNLEGLTKYIPAETIALYLAFLPAVSGQSAIAGILLVLVLAGATALFYVLVTLAADRQLPEKPEKPPLKRKKVQWNIAASLISYVVWVLAIPGNPALFPDNVALVSPVLISPLALLISTILTQLESAFGMNSE